MDAIRAALQRLQNVPSKSWKGNKEAEDAITQVSAIVRLFELPAASTATFNRLRQILRTKLLPLYHVSLGLALELTTAILLFLHNNPQVPTHTSGNTQTSCEILLMALVSGILDFVEEDASVKTREIVASSLYPILCPTYILAPYQSLSLLHSKVAPLVYQTFTATAESCPKNTAKLRDQFLNCRNLGYTISITREFLALEALLDLFAILIPPAKASRVARTRYFTSVFSTEFYGNTGKEIVEHLEAITTPEWSVTSREILGMLAKSSIVYPQPLEGRDFILGALPIEGCSHFYIGKSQLIANIDKDGELETLHVSLPTILGLKTTQAATPDEVNVIITLSQPPVLGDAEMVMESQQEIRFSFIMKAVQVTHFENVLQQRNLVPRQFDTRKLSKGQPINLDSNAPQDVESMKLTQQERLNELSMNILTSPQAVEGGRNSTQISPSPVIRRGDRSRYVIQSLESTPKKPQTRATASKAVLPSTVFVDSDGQLSLKNPKLQNHAELPKPQLRTRKVLVPPPSPSPAPKKRAGTSTVDNRAESKSKYFGQKAANKKGAAVESKVVVVASGPSEKEEDIGDLPVVVSPIVPQRHYPTRSASGGALVKKNNENDDAKNAHVPGNKSVQTPKKRNRRVVMSEDENATEDDIMGIEGSPNKKPRLETVLPPSTRTYKKAKYGKKGRTSSPGLEATETHPIYIDFDEVPTSGKGVNTASKKAEKKDVVNKKWGKENLPLKERAQVVKKEAAKADQEKEKRQLRAKVRQKEDVLKEVKPKPEATSRAPPVRPANHVIKPERAPVRVTHQTSRTAKEVDKSDSIIEIFSPEKIPKVVPWDNIDTSSDPIVLPRIADNCSKDSDASDDAYNAGNRSKADAAAKFTSENEFGFMDEVEELPPPVLVRDFAELVVRKQVAPAPGPPQKSKPPPTPVDVNPVYTKQEPIHVVDLTSHHNLVSSELMQEEEEVHILPMDQTSEPHDMDVRMASPDGEQENMHMTPKRAPVATKVSQDAKMPALEAPRKALISKLSVLKTPEVQIDNLAAQPRAIPRQMLELQSVYRISVARAQSPSGHRMPDGYKEQVPFRDETPPKPRQSAFRRTERNKTRRQEVREDPMTRIVQILAEINDAGAIITKIERRFDVVTEGLTTGQRIILEGTAKTLQEMHQESILYFNQMVDLEGQYTLHSSRIFTTADDFHKSSEQLSRCFNTIKINHSRESLSKKLPTSLFPKIPAIISDPTLHF